MKWFIDVCVGLIGVSVSAAAIALVIWSWMSLFEYALRAFKIHKLFIQFLYEHHEKKVKN